MEKFLPRQATIEHFGAGGFRFGGMSHQGSLLILPSGMRAWQPTATIDLTPQDFSGLLTERASFDFLLIGTGPTMSRLPPAVSTFLKSELPRFDIMSTSAAIHTYNIVLAEKRRIAAALILVSNAVEKAS